MFDYFRSLGLVDLLGLVLLSISIGLGFVTESLIPILPFESPIVVIAGIAIVSGALGSILLSESGKRVADEIDPQIAEGDEMISEQQHRENVNRAYRQGFAEGHSEGFREGVDKGAELTRQSGTNQSQGNQQHQGRTSVSDRENLSDDQDEPERETEDEFE